MKFSIVTIFPDLVNALCSYGLLSKAIQNHIIGVKIYDLRDFTTDKHRKVDDRPFGGGAGMVMKPEPFFNVVNHIQSREKGKVILFSAYAPCLTQDKVKELSLSDHLILLCGRYEGIDQRVIDTLVDEEISIGEYVLMGGELAAGVLVDSVSRMIPGVIGNPESVESDSFYKAEQFGYPQYTQPQNFQGLTVPEILLSGHHEKIAKWRKDNQKKR